MKVLHDEAVKDGIMVLEAGDSITVQEGEVMVIVPAPPLNPTFTLKVGKP